MKFYVLRPVVSVPNEVNIFGPHLQIRLVRRGDTTCSFGLLRLNTTRQTNNAYLAGGPGLFFIGRVYLALLPLTGTRVMDYIS
jgi:hypothetical protein